jgi:hypothetical protein
MRELINARIKLRRAQEHLEELDREIRLWSAGDPYRIRIASDPSGTVHELIVAVDCEPDGPRWAVLVGDCAHNLRSALDHLIWTISGTDPPERFEFPIFKTPVRRRAVGLEYSFRNKIEGVTAKPIRDLIEQCQPCNVKGAPPERDVLWMLHRLDVVDRRRLVVPQLFENLDAPKMAFQFSRPAAARQLVKNTDPVDDGDTLLTILTDDPVGLVDATVVSALRVGIDVRELGIREGPACGPIPALLAEAAVAVETIIVEVERALP